MQTEFLLVRRYEYTSQVGQDSGSSRRKQAVGDDRFVTSQKAAAQLERRGGTQAAKGADRR